MRLPIPYTVATILCLGGLVSACAPSKPRQVEADGRITPPREAATGQPAGAAQDSFRDVTYTVKRGDTLIGIARTTTGDGSNWRPIAANNGIFEPARIAVGQQIRIPSELLPGTNAQPGPDRTRVAGGEAGPAASGQGANDGSSDHLPSEGAVAGWIEISGNYYAREINRRPDIASAIIRRVAPGTRLSYVGRTNGWYKVKLDSGFGYVNPRYADVAAAR